MTTFYNSKANSSSGENRFVHRGRFRLDLTSNQILLDDRFIELPPCTFDYLVTLVRHSPNPVSYKQLVMESQGLQLPALDAQDMARLRIYMLRKVIEEDQQKPQYIRAVAGYGYRLIP